MDINLNLKRLSGRGGGNLYEISHVDWSSSRSSDVLVGFRSREETKLYYCNARELHLSRVYRVIAAFAVNRAVPPVDKKAKRLIEKSLLTTTAIVRCIPRAAII